MTNINKSDTHTTGAMKLSTLSSEESLNKSAEDVAKPSPFNRPSSSSVRGRKSGYVEVVTTKDGKRCIRELDRALPKVPVAAQKDMGVSPPRDHIRGKSAERAPIQDHSYQNVAEIKRPKSASSARVAGVLDIDHKSRSNHSSMKKVTSADFQLSTVTDSDV